MAISRYAQVAVLPALLAAILPAMAQNPDAGRQTAERLCARCHAIAPGLKSRHMLAPTFPEIANRYSVWGLQEALAEGIVVGHPEMPKFVFTPEVIDNLLTYMDTFTVKKNDKANQKSLENKNPK